ncbi:MAG: hypothetical protein LBV02_09270 [Bacteroidales bacterium]|jgi:hypothetical protein|nr:hypothetical protein [Bacteroidales bacterium]
MKKLLMISLLFFSLSSYAQRFDIVERNPNYVKQKDLVDFEFIDEHFDLSGYEKIVAFQGCTTNSGNHTLANLFNSYWKTANSLGANAFTVDEVKNSSDTIYVRISAYYLNEEALEKNFKLYPRNMVYVLGDLLLLRGKSRKLTFNGLDRVLAPHEYIAYQNKVGEYVKVENNGFLGGKVDVFGQPGRLPTFLSLTGVEVNATTTAKLSFKAGGIYPVDLNFGQFLIRIFNRQ